MPRRPRGGGGSRPVVIQSDRGRVGRVLVSFEASDPLRYVLPGRVPCRLLSSLPVLDRPLRTGVP